MITIPRSDWSRSPKSALYEQVWSEPVIKAAQKYGITGTARPKRSAEVEAHAKASRIGPSEKAK